jgi:hypothetical protein
MKHPATILIIYGFAFQACAFVHANQTASPTIGEFGFAGHGPLSLQNNTPASASTCLKTLGKIIISGSTKLCTNIVPK